MDILWKNTDGVFSYRAAGILRYRGKILLQHASNEPGYVVPGGHVAFGETTAQTLRREFREECGAEIIVGALCGVGEIYFPWGEKPCHQICLYYHVSLADPSAFPTDGVIPCVESWRIGIFPLISTGYRCKSCPASACTRRRLSIWHRRTDRFRSSTEKKIDHALCPYPE